MTLTQTISFSGGTQCPQLNFKSHSVLRELEVNLTERSHLESAARWVSGTLLTATSNVFTKLTISIALVSVWLRATGENYVRGWNSVDNALDRLSLREKVTLVVKLKQWAEEDKIVEVIKTYFPSMWESGRVVVEIPPPPVRDEAQADLLERP